MEQGHTPSTKECTKVKMPDRVAHISANTANKGMKKKKPTSVAAKKLCQRPSCDTS